MKKIGSNIKIFFNKIKARMLRFAALPVIEDKENPYTGNGLYQKFWDSDPYFIRNGERAPIEENKQPEKTPNR